MYLFADISIFTTAWEFEPYLAVCAWSLPVACAKQNISPCLTSSGDWFGSNCTSNFLLPANPTRTSSPRYSPPRILRSSRLNHDACLIQAKDRHQMSRKVHRVGISWRQPPLSTCNGCYHRPSLSSCLSEAQLQS